MRTQPDSLRRFDRRRRIFRPAVLALLLVGGLVLAGASGATPTGVPDDLAEAAVAALGERFEVLTLSDRYVLRSRAEQTEGTGGITLEILPGEVLLDGDPVDSERLVELFGEADADQIVQLTGAADLEELRQRLAEMGERQRERIDERIEQIDQRMRRELERLEERRRELEESRGERSEKPGRARPRVRTDTRFSMGSSLTIDPDEVARDVVVVGGSIDVQGEVKGDAVAVFGSVEVNNVVDGAVTAVLGSVFLGPNARVDGDVVSVGGAIHQDPAAVIDGEIIEIAFAPVFLDIDEVDWPHWSISDWWSDSWFGFSWPDFFKLLFNTGVLTFLALILILVARNYLEGVGRRSLEEPWRAGLVGLLIEVLFLPILCIVCLLLTVSVVGIPLMLVLLPLSILGLIVLFFLGYAGVALAIGRAAEGRRGVPTWSPYAAILVGILMIQSWQLLGEGLTAFGGPIRWTAWLIIAFGFLLKYCVWTVGLGAVVLQRFSRVPTPVDTPPIDPLDPPTSTDGLVFDLESPPPPESSDPGSPDATSRRS